MCCWSVTAGGVASHRAAGEKGQQSTHHGQHRHAESDLFSQAAVWWFRIYFAWSALVLEDWESAFKVWISNFFLPLYSRTGEPLIFESHRPAPYGLHNIEIELSARWGLHTVASFLLNPLLFQSP